MTREEQLEAALRELTEVAKRAVRLAVQYPDFHLPAMEPMHQGIDIARAALAAPATAQGDDFLRGWEAGRDAAAHCVYLARIGEADGDFRCIIANIKQLTPPAPGNAKEDSHE
jgi:malonyl CoA-acyl carrier protein transacylase